MVNLIFIYFCDCLFYRILVNSKIGEIVWGGFKLSRDYGIVSLIVVDGEL